MVPDVAEGANEARHGVPVLLGGIGAEDGIELADAKAGQLFLQLVMTHYLVGAHGQAPVTGFRPGGGGDHLPSW